LQELNMSRHSLMAALVVAVLGGLVSDVHAGNQARHERLRHYLTGYGRGPFGYGYFPYPEPIPNYGPYVVSIQPIREIGGAPPAAPSTMPAGN
jgi:hypothetical protein